MKMLKIRGTLRSTEYLSIIGIVLFIFYAYVTGGLIKYTFGNYRNATIILAVYLLILISVVLIKRKKIIAHIDLIIYPILAAVVIHGNANLKNNDYVNLVMTIGVFAFALVLRRMDNWEIPAVKTIIVVSAFFAIVSVAFGLMPSFYTSTIVPLFFDLNQTNLIHLQSSGILCGLTNSNGFNAILMVNGLCAITSFLMTSNSFTKRKWIDRGIGLLFLVILLMTGKRGPLVFCLAGIFTAYFVYHSNNPTNRIIKILAIVLAAMIIWVLGSSVFPQAFPTIGRLIGTDTIDAVRFKLYNQAIDAFKGNFLFGIGWDAFRYTFMTFGNALNVHNIYIQLLCECGIIGFIAFVLFFLWNIVSAIKKLRRVALTPDCDSKIRIILTFSVMYQVFFLMYGLTGNPLYDAPTLVVYILCCTASMKIVI